MSTVATLPTATTTTATVNTGDFRTAVRHFAAAIPTGKVNGIPRLISIEPNNNGTMTVFYSSYETYAAVTMPAQTTAASSLKVEGRAFNKMLTTALGGSSKSINGADLELSFNDDKLTFECDGVQINVAGVDNEESAEYDSYRAGVLKAEDKATGVTLATVAATDIVRMYNSVARSAGTDNTLPMLTGINMAVEDNRLVFTATDRFRLSRLAIDADISAQAVEFDGHLVPAPAYKTLVSLLPNDDTAVRIYLSNDDFLVFETDTVTFGTRMLDANFPATSQLIGKDFNHVIKFDRKELEKAVTKLTKLTVDQSSVTFTSTSNGVTLEAQIFANEPESRATVELEAKETAYVEDYETMHFRLNGEFMKDAIKSYDGETVTLALSQPSRPMQMLEGNLTVENGDGTLNLSAHDHVELLMPVRLPG